MKPTLTRCDYRCDLCLAADIPEDDYNCFIRPYENKRRLEVLAQEQEIGRN